MAPKPTDASKIRFDSLLLSKQQELKENFVKNMQTKHVYILSQLFASVWLLGSSGANVDAAV
jgi:hypothetical protein